MDSIRRAEDIVAARLRLAAAREPVPGEAVGATAAELAVSISADSPHAGRFRAEVDAAVHGTALALDAARPHPDDLWAHAKATHPDPTVWFEQAVVLGHPTHPLARSRGGLDDAAIAAFAPEHRPRYSLGLHSLDGLTTSSGWPVHAHGRPLLPVHPWQAARHGLAQPTRTLADAAPLMSLRTVSTGDWHCKCAIDLRLTSAVRHVSDTAAANGPALTRLLTAPAAAAGITVLPEQSATAGPHLAAIVRPAPHTLAAGEVVPVAALAEPCPATGRPIAAAIARDDLDRWWADLAAVVAAPLRLFAATGVALEAHGQNLLVAFDAGRPARLLYRDFGGLRVPATGWPTLAGEIQTDDEDERVRKLLAALYPTTLTALVDALAAWTDTDPGRWWKTAAEPARTAAGPAPALTDALFAPTWPIKATTAMRLADRPTLDLWAEVDNPMAQA